jgi:Spy/CpxP family protein refolding chaperone
MKFMKTGICLVGILMFLCPVVAKAEGGSSQVRWWRIPEMASKLDLTQQERKGLEDLFTQKRKVLFQMRSEVEKQRFELENVLEGQTLDQRAAFEQFNRLEEKRQRLAAERFKYLLEVRRILGRDRYLTLMGMAKENRAKRGPSQEDEFSPR